MKAEMAPRNSADGKIDKGTCTDFVLHKSQQTKFAGIQHKIADYTEYKLLNYAENVKDQQQKLVLMAMLGDYKSGMIAVAWKRGNPVYVRVTKNC
jgi:hypothetical protein